MLSRALQIRLRAEYEKIRLIPENDMVEIRPAPGETPPCVQLYHVTYNVPTWVEDGGQLKKQTRTVVEISLSGLHAGPRARVIEGKVPFHPAWFTSGAACGGGARWPEMWLYEYMFFIGELLQFQPERMNFASPANAAASYFWRANLDVPGRIPTDSRPFPKPQPPRGKKIKVVKCGTPNRENSSELENITSGDAPRREGEEKMSEKMSAAYRAMLANLYGELMALPESEMVEIAPAPGEEPPYVRTYRVTYHVPTWVLDGDTLRRQARTVVEFTALEENWARVQVIEGRPPFHPNWWLSGVGDPDLARKQKLRLSEYVAYYGELLQFQEKWIDPRSPANSRALSYWQEHRNDPGMFPTDARPFPGSPEKDG